MIPDDLTTAEAEELYKMLDDLAEYRRTDGRGRSEEAQYVRDYCETERARVKAEIRQRGLPGTRPGDTRVYGPGGTFWQRAGDCESDLRTRSASQQVLCRSWA